MKQRPFSRFTFLLFFSFLLLTFLPQSVFAQSKPPHIIFILADDLGYGDVSALNPDSKIHTPNLDRIAKEGTIFTSAHSPVSVCSPTRYGFLTGRYAFRSTLKKGVLRPYNKPLIHAGRKTVASLLKAEGYRTACVGKWHLGWNWPTKDGNAVVDTPGYCNVDFARPITGGPTELGFDYYFGTDVPNYPPYTYIENNRVMAVPTAFKPDSFDLRSGIMKEGWDLRNILPDLFKKAEEVITKAKEDKVPLFLYLPLTSPHTPIAPIPSFKGRNPLGDYASFVEQTDFHVGELLKKLDELGLAENTLLVFTSDNGCAPYIGAKEMEDNFGHRVSYQFRGYKADTWEGGHHVPLLIRWPSKIKASTRSDQLVCHTDFLATFSEWFKKPLAGNEGEDSESFLPVLLQKATRSSRNSLVTQSGYGYFSIQEGDWKLITIGSSGGYNDSKLPLEELKKSKPQLYNLKEDISETTNLAERYPEKVKALTEKLSLGIRNGRTTKGKPQQNELPHWWPQLTWLPEPAKSSNPLVK